MHSFFNRLRQHPHSLFGKAQVRPGVVLGGMVSAIGLANFFPENIVGGVVAAIVNGFIIAGFAPWWRADNKQSTGLSYCLYPRIRMLAAAEACLLVFLAGLLAIGHFVLGPDSDAAYGCLLAAVNMASVLASGQLPIWRDWPAAPKA